MCSEWFSIVLHFVLLLEQPIDCKRDQFRKYIESKGVVDMLTKVLIKLLDAPVKPEHPMDFIRDNLGATHFEKNQIEQLEQTVKDYKHEVDDLKFQIEELKKKLNEKNASETAKDVVVPAVIVESISDDKDIPAIQSPVKVAAVSISVEESDKKIAESEKAIAPATPEVDEIKSIESAVVVETVEPAATAIANGDATVVTEPSVTVEGATEGGNVADEKKDVVKAATEVKETDNKEITEVAAAETAKA